MRTLASFACLGAAAALAGSLATPAAGSAPAFDPIAPLAARLGPLDESPAARPLAPRLAELRAAILLLGEGDRLSRAGDREKARTRWRSAASAFARAQDGLGEADALLRIGWSHLVGLEFLADPAKISEGLSALLRGMLLAATVLEEAGAEASDHRRAIRCHAEARFETGLGLARAGRCPEAIPWLEDSERLYEDLGVAAGEAKSSIVRALCFSEQSDRWSALSALGEALQLVDALPTGTTNDSASATDRIEQGDPHGAAELLEEEIRRRSSEGDDDAVARLRLDLGATRALLGDLDAAEVLLEQGLHHFEYHVDEYSLENQAAAYHNLGGVALERGRLRHAGEQFERAVRAWQEIGRPDREALSLSALGFTRLEQGDYRGAAAALRDAWHLKQRLSFDPESEADLLNNLGGLHFRLGDLQRALDLFHRTLDLRRAPAEDELLAVFAQADGALPEPLAATRDAFQLSPRLLPPAKLAATLVNLANTEISLGETARGLAHLRQAEPILERTDASPISLAKLHSSLGFLLLQTGETEAATALLRRSLETWETVGSPERTALASYHLALASQGAHDLPATRELAKKGLTLLGGDGDPALTSALLTLLGTAELGLERPGPAARHARRALAVAGREPSAAIGAHILTAAVSWAEGEIASARRHSVAMVEALETMLDGLSVTELKASFLGREQVAWAYHLAVLTTLASGDSDEAFALAERSRARALLDRLGGARPAPRDPVGAAEARERAARARLVELDRQVADGRFSLDPPALAALLDERDAARRGLSEARMRRQLEGGEPSGGTGEPTRSLAEVRAQLDEGVTLVEFHVVGDGMLGEGPVVAWAVDREESAALVLPITNRRLGHRIEQLRRAIEARDPGYREAATELYDALVRPLLPHLRHRRLILAAHGSLHHLPFATLFDAERGRFLIDDFDLVQVPSASALDRMRPVAPAGWSRALVVGDPDETLPSAAEEARAVAAAYGAEPLIGAAATEAVVAERAPDAEILHLASHAVLNRANLLFSHVALAGGGDADGRLEAHEVYRLDLRGVELVVLSGCETQAGVPGAGDEVASLARAFLAAGAAGVVGGLWRVEDRATGELMVRLHRYLRSGVEPARALRWAQIEMRERGAPPYDWAGFSFTGR